MFLKPLRGHEKHGKSEELSQTGGDWAIQQLNVMWYSDWILEQKEAASRKTDKI